MKLMRLKVFCVCGHSCGQSGFSAQFDRERKSCKRRCHKALRRFALPRPGYRHGTPKPRVLSAELHPDIQFLPLYHDGEENQRYFCLWSFLWSKPLLCRFRQPEENPLSPVPQGIPGFCPSRAWIGSTHSQTVCGNFAYYTSFLRVLQEGETLRMGGICRTTIHIEQEYNTRHGLQAIQ